MKHPVRDRFWILFCSLCALCVAAAAVALLLGKITVDPAVVLLGRVSNMTVKVKGALVAAAVVMVLFALRLFSIILPKKKKHSSSFAIQHNENGMVRISVKALEALVQRCLNQHAEIKVVSSSLFSDEETVRVDVHIALQSDISMPLAISSLQKQIKRYLEACSGVKVKEVRVFVDGAIPANAKTAESPFAIPASMLGQESLSELKEEELVIEQEAPVKEEPVKEEAVQETETLAEEAAAQETAEEAPAQEAAAEAAQEVPSEE